MLYTLLLLLQQVLTLSYGNTSDKQEVQASKASVLPQII